MSDWYELCNDEDVLLSLIETPLKLAEKSITSQQWNLFEYATQENDGFDGFNKVWNILSRLIGDFMIVFSELEVNLDIELHQLINWHSEQLGMIITRDMEYEQKVDLYIDLLRSLPIHNEAQVDYIAKLKKHLIRVAEIRNAVAHAKWPSIDKNGYVFSRVQKINSKIGMPELKYYKLDAGYLKEAYCYATSVGNMPVFLNDNVFYY